MCFGGQLGAACETACCIIGGFATARLAAEAARTGEAATTSLAAEAACNALRGLALCVGLQALVLPEEVVDRKILP